MGFDGFHDCTPVSENLVDDAVKEGDAATMIVLYKNKHVNLFVLCRGRRLECGNHVGPRGQGHLKQRRLFRRMGR
jgi:hypothetical protein